ncbi:MAG: beta-ketoacyl-[acyl-carrier-protein] synthase family protein [Nitrospiraceae bacterium]|nr:MAG: beta-ketoacyl-[acyl-carrier-protein] synthase family protein [Nitrospiraceae bacterium]
MNKRKVVITGLGMATALGLDVEENWQKALSGISGISKLTYPHAENSKVQAVGEIKSTNWARLQQEFPEDAVREGERRTLFALWAAQQALKDGGLVRKNTEHRSQNIDKKNAENNLGSGLWAPGSESFRSGVILAAGLGINRLEDVQKWIGKDGNFAYERFGREHKGIHRESIVKNNSHRPSALIAKRFGLNGYNATVTTACASASQAIGLAFRLIRRGDADMMLAGGADSMINPVGLIFFVLLGAAASSADSPEETCRPFDRKRGGLVMGEGAGIVVLEEEAHALKRGAKIYAEVAGYGTTIDAYQVTAPHPKGEGAEHAMRAALLDADTAPGEIDYINAHGTSTKLNDSAETLAIKNVFKEHAYSLCVNSSKSIIGHLIAASGGPELIFTALSVLRNEIHPTLNLKNPDPKCDLDYVPNVKRAKIVRSAISNSFGFGGQNASIIIKKFKS